jgi:N-acetylmuramoyl-L-alanine amidase
MRSLLLALIPGMAVAALAGQDLPQPAEVHYGYAGPLQANAWQVGMECYVPVAATRAWGWKVSVAQFDAKVEAEGRTIRVPYRIQAGQQVVPLGLIVKQLGGSSGWKVGTGTFEVWSVLGRVKVGEAGVEVDAPFPVQARLGYLKDAGKAVLDLHGARIESYSEIELPSSARVAQHRPNVVRITLDTAQRFLVDERHAKPARQLDAKLGDADHPQAAREAPAPEKVVPKEPVVLQPEPEPEPVPPPNTGIMAGPVRVSEEGPIVTILDVPITAPLADAPRISRPLPHVLRLVLPGAGYQPMPNDQGYGGAVQKVVSEQHPHAVAVEITLARPVGLEMSYTGGNVRLTLIKPKVGDGKLAGKTVVVDAGHGGHDSGARSPDKGTREKDLALKVALKTASALAAEGATVILTRKSDVFIELKERSEIANRNGADFFISCHINSNRNPGSSSGTITFHHKKDPIGILLAECLHRELIKAIKLPSKGVWSDQRIYNSGFAVLRYANMPAVLLELGFINHKTDRARMTSASFPDDVARAVVRGLRIFLGDVKAKEED